MNRPNAQPMSFLWVLVVTVCFIDSVILYPYDIILIQYGLAVSLIISYLLFTVLFSDGLKP